MKCFSLVLLGVLLAAKAFADPCLDQDLSQNLLASVKVKVTDNQPFDRCQNNSHTYTILTTLALLKSIRFDDRILGKPFNQNILLN